MSKAIKKHLNIEIEYVDNAEIRIVFNQILKQLANGKNYNRQLYRNSFYEFKKTLMSFPEYREEKINGVWYMVIDSKMNKKQ